MATAPLFRILSYGKKYKRRAFLASACSVINKLFDIAPEILIGIALDVVVRRDDSFVASVGIVDPKQQLMVLGLLTFLIWAFESLFEYLYLILWRNLAQDVQHQFRNDAYQHVQNMDVAYFENQPSGRLTAILNDDINQLERFLNVGANDILQVTTAVLGVGAVFFVLSPKIAVLAFLPIPIIVIGAFYFQKKAEPKYAKVRELAGRLAGAITNNIAGVATIKSFTREGDEAERISALSQKYSIANTEAIKISSAFIPVIRMAILSGFLFTFILGGLDTLNGKLEVGAYGVLVFLTQRLLWPFTSLAVTMDLYERGMASARRIFNLLDEPIDIVDQANAQPMELKGGIAFHEVNFKYASSPHNILSDLNLDIPANTTHAFVGQTGSGKSTLVKLLLRFYEPQSGEIRIGQQPISTITLNALRAQIGLVSQDIYLFNDSVYSNILFGQPNATEADVKSAARLAECEEFIEQLADGYDTKIGEGGVRLSGGQKQRLSLARAILKNPKILILDEATSAVDNETEAAIQKSLANIAKDRTVIMIAHRLSTIVAADQIHVLEAGRIVESGTHAELIEQDGIYKKLWAVQTGLPTS
ncbi:MAG: ABC transporter ATP-binding protein/permease [Saprospiraceae bacterium]|nr:ABC transporter ATP-binding protein/permease [Saprospiraceae bacterium]